MGGGGREAGRGEEREGRSSVQLVPLSEYRGCLAGLIRIDLTSVLTPKLLEEHDRTPPLLLATTIRGEGGVVGKTREA